MQGKRILENIGYNVRFLQWVKWVKENVYRNAE